MRCAVVKWLVAWLVWGFAGCVQERVPTLQHVRASIVNGTLDATDEHRAVVVLYVGFAMCTGTLIADRVVMTAAHCVEGLRPKNVGVGFGARLNAAVWRKATEIWVHPDWDTERIQNDIALIRLDEAAPDGIRPIPFLPKALALTKLDLKSEVEFVGFGETETGNSGVKMHVSNSLDWVCLSSLGCFIKGGGWANPKTICTDQEPGAPCSGDSGGPAFIRRNGREYVAGITSYGDENCAVFGCSTKVDEFEREILDFLGVTGELGSACAADAQCTAGHCAHGVCCETGCDGVCQACDLAGSIGTCRPVADGTSCPDGDRCNGNETCRAGGCQAGAPLVCADQSACTADTCDPKKGCVFSPLGEGTSCDDQDACSLGDACNKQGRCVATLRAECDDGNPCTLDACDATTGCAHTARSDGTACDPGVCGTAASCQGGACLVREGKSCDDDNPCTLDACDPLAGCQNRPLPDGQGCGACQQCAASQCLEVPDCQIAAEDKVDSGCGCNQVDPLSSLSAWVLALLGMALLRIKRP